MGRSPTFYLASITRPEPGLSKITGYLINHSSKYAGRVGTSAEAEHADSVVFTVMLH